MWVHSHVAANCSRNAARFAEALNDPDGGREAAEALRSLIGEVIVTPGEKPGEVHAQLRGVLTGIPGIATFQPEQGRTPVLPSVAARPCNHPVVPAAAAITRSACCWQRRSSRRRSNLDTRPCGQIAQ